MMLLVGSRTLTAGPFGIFGVLANWPTHASPGAGHCRGERYHMMLHNVNDIRNLVQHSWTHSL